MKVELGVPVSMIQTVGAIAQSLCVLPDRDSFAVLLQRAGTGNIRQHRV